MHISDITILIVLLWFSIVHYSSLFSVLFYVPTIVPVNEHIKAMSEIFEWLAVIGDTVSEEDRVVHLLASLPELYNVLVTALEAQSEKTPK